MHVWLGISFNFNFGYNRVAKIHQTTDTFRFKGCVLHLDIYFGLSDQLSLKKGQYRPRLFNVATFYFYEQMKCRLFFVTLLYFTDKDNRLTGKIQKACYDLAVC